MSHDHEKKKHHAPHHDNPKKTSGSETHDEGKLHQAHKHKHKHPHELGRDGDYDEMTPGFGPGTAAKDLKADVVTAFASGDGSNIMVDRGTDDGITTETPACYFDSNGTKYEVTINKVDATHAWGTVDTSPTVVKQTLVVVFNSTK